MKHAFFPQTRFTLAALIGMVALCMLMVARHAHAQTVRFDTLYAEGCPVLWEGEPEVFYLYPIPFEHRHLLRSEYYRGVVLDEHLHIAALDPMTCWAKQGLTIFDHYNFGFCDSTVLMFRSAAWYLSHLQSKEAVTACYPNVAAISELPYGRTDVNELHPYIANALNIERLGPDHYRCYIGQTIWADVRKPIEMKGFSPFLTFEITCKKGKWRQRFIPHEGELCRIPEAARVNSMFYGSTYVAMNAQGIWRADAITPQVTRYDHAGRCLDSIPMQSASVSDSSFLVYDIQVSQHKNTDRFMAQYNYYFGLWVSNRYVVRCVYTAGDPQRQWIIYNIQSQKIQTVRLPEELKAVSIEDNFVYLGGARMGDRIAIPYIDLDQFF